MQNPNPASYGLPSGSGAPHYTSFPSNNGGNGSNGNDAEGDLPTSLPSYIPQQPAQQQQVPQMLPFGFDMLGRPQLAKPDELQAHFVTEGMPSSKRQATMGQWKTPPQFLYPSNPSVPSPASVTNPRALAANKVANRPRDASQPSPSTGMRGMSFQDPSYSEDEKRPPPPREIAGISAAQFAASTGGLTMDATLLARVTGTDPALVGSEEIKQIMRTPDLLSIYQKLQEEDDRRQRRLERNRASARVRREKKKNMVEMYEGEVSKLENSLNLLKSHTFGTGNANDLINALDPIEYTGGEHLRHAMMSKEAKTELMGRILDQHSKNTAAIRKSNLENQVLLAAASENSELFTTLRTQLRLTDEQCRHLQLAQRAREEAHKLEVIAKCFSALRAHDWLYCPGIEALLQQSRNTMTQQQFQKFLTWTQDNSDIIEKLQVTQAAPPETERDLEFFFAED
ncbi:hypothetical protein Poli38472_000234 [Pythium oligandrum]|uniref:BZIP domain-containing protein n=1 Tax=Pythium oligandrum TaxID=41045 RepID=A0A8K1CDA3_PYTOL|nr:hypothetical protein Poli38472_000234 [Pythium oligandrum]|eukprot:TMW60192.1 hypothetical protein Poli38472_000234 [Pythium oligandrum]